jgi:hypothetical protein
MGVEANYNKKPKKKSKPKSRGEMQAIVLCEMFNSDAPSSK